MDITVALGGGGVKGFAHIGVLRVLEANGFRIRAVAGTSAGGMIGAFYAAGYSLDELEKNIIALDQSRLYFRMPGDGPSLMGLGGVVNALADWLNGCTFDELKLPFAVTAVDLDTGQPVIVNRGSVQDAVLATIAVPGIFPPRVVEGRTLIDGGILDPVPVNLARMLAPNLPVVAVVLAPKLSEWANNSNKIQLLGSMALLKPLAQNRLAQSLGIFLRSVDIAGCLLTDLRLQTERPEVIIRPEVGPFGLVDKVDVKTVIQIGEEAAEKALPELRRWGGWRRHRSIRSSGIDPHLPGQPYGS